LTSSPPDPQVPAQASSDWLDGLVARPPRRALGPLQLAWLGDAIWELHQRLHHCQLPAQSKDLHQAVVAAVRADAQARLLQQLEPELRPEELDLVRRARNRAGPGPRRGEASSYGQATGFEALLGWLFLHDPARLVELLDHLKENDP
jgi:ribonuclease-3 family protein